MSMLTWPCLAGPKFSCTALLLHCHLPEWLHKAVLPARAWPAARPTCQRHVWVTTC